MNTKQVKITTPLNPVKAKARLGGPHAVNSDILDKAEEAVAAMTPEYLDWVKHDLAKLEEAYDDLVTSEEQTIEICQRIFLIAHDMKGQGGTFGFDLITIIGDRFCQMIHKIDRIRQDEVEAIRVFIDALTLVINEEIKGMGSKEGERILSGLEKVANKILGYAPPKTKS